MGRPKKPLFDRAIGACLKEYKGHFANGEKANNKLHCEQILKNFDLLHRILDELAGQTMELTNGAKPQFITAVPDGANWIARRMMLKYGVEWDTQLILLSKNKDNGAIDFKSDYDRRICEDSKTGALYEDVFNRFTNINRALVVPALGERVIAAVSIFDRNPCGQRHVPHIPHASVFSKDIPAELPADHRLWQVTK